MAQVILIFFFDVGNGVGDFWVNTLRPRQNGRHFQDEIFKCIILNENGWISIKSSLNIVPKGSVSNIPDHRQAIIWTNDG